MIFIGNSLTEGTENAEETGVFYHGKHRKTTENKAVSLREKLLESRFKKNNKFKNSRRG